jgi:hypothetical protein
VIFHAGKDISTTGFAGELAELECAFVGGHDFGIVRKCDLDWCVVCGFVFDGGSIDEEVVCGSRIEDSVVVVG